MKANWQGFLLGTLAAMLVLAVGYGLLFFVAVAGIAADESVLPFRVLFLALTLSFLSSIVSLLAYRSASDAVAGESISFSKFFNFDRIGGLLLTWLLVGVITLVGLLLLIIPGLVFSVLASFALPAYLRSPAIGPWGAIKQSIQVVKNNVAETLLFVLLTIGLSSLAGWTMIAVVFSVPFTALVSTVLYEQSRGANSLLRRLPGVNDPSGFTGAYPYNPGAGTDNPYRSSGLDQGCNGASGAEPDYRNYPGTGPAYPEYPGSSEPSPWQGYPHPEYPADDDPNNRPQR